jgi:LPXTG-motif cell wall-anchored protein
MRDVNVSNRELSAPYIATLAAMDGSGPRGRTLLTVVAALLALFLVPASAALAQSAGDRQYADPLVTDGGQDPPPADPDTPVSSDDPASGDTGAGTTAPPPGAEPAAADAATLPHTGSDTWLVALIGAALTAGGALALAAARPPRHARR